MKAHTASLINGIILVAMSAWGYFASDNPSTTALIPAAFGVVLLVLNSGLKKESKVVSHIIVLLTLLIIIALIKPLTAAIDDDRTMAIVRVGIMLASSIFAMFYFVKSFIAARNKA